MGRYWISYDISDPKRWQRVYNVLMGYGAWRQFSVFEVHIDDHKMVELRAKLMEAVNPEEDRLILLPVCDHCYEKAEFVGMAEAKRNRRDEGFRVI